MTTLEETRKVMREFLDDMAALKQVADVGNPDAAPFVAAFAAARERAIEAAQSYTAAVRGT